MDSSIIQFWLTVGMAVWIAIYSVALLYLVSGLRKSTQRVARFTNRLSAFLANMTDEQLDALFARINRMATRSLEYEQNMEQ